MDEPPHGPPPQTRWSLEHAVAVLHQNGFKLKLDTLSKFEGGIEFEVYSAQDSYGQSIVFKYPRERWVYNDNDYGIDRCQLLRQERDLLRFAGEHGYLSQRYSPTLTRTTVRWFWCLSKSTWTGRCPATLRSARRCADCTGCRRRRCTRSPKALSFPRRRLQNSQSSV